MPPHFDLLIRGGTCVLAAGEAAVDVGVRDGRIAWLGRDPRASGTTIIEARHLHVLPGLIDPHVHLRDPGDPAIESIATGTRAAVLGGLTAVFDMPNTNPAIVDAARVAWKQAHIEATAWCDMGFYVGATKTNAEALASLEGARGVCAVKVFAGSSTGDLLVEDDASLERVMRHGRRRVAYHSEDEYRLRARAAMFASGGPYRYHTEWRDEECAALGTRRIIALARRTGRPAHILHVSTAEELVFLRDCRDIATSEMLVNHLTQVAPDVYDRLGGYGVMNPPIRDERHRAAAWAAITDGTIDTIGSDHAPHSRAMKEKPWPACAAGLTGVQTLVPVMLDHVNAGRLSLGRLVELLSAGPARVYGMLGKGQLAAGYDADFTVVDLRHRRRIEDSWIVSPCGWTPFAGMSVTGWPVATIVRGAAVMRDDVVCGTPRGRLVNFHVVALLALGALLTTGTARAQTSAAAPTPGSGTTVNEGPIRAYFDDWSARVAAARASQPSWSSPLVTSTAMLEQRFRFDMSYQHSGNGTSTEVLDGGKGVDLIVGETEEVQIASDPYYIRTSKRTKNELEGFADWPVLRFKQRIASGEDFVISAWLQLQVPSGYKRLTSGAVTLIPTLGFGKSFGPLIFQGTIGAAIPSAHEDQIGTQLTANLAVQLHVLRYLWPQIEVNQTLYADGPRSGLDQVYLTPGLVIGRFALGGSLATTVGLGYQTALSPTYRAAPLAPGFDHAWLFTSRLTF